MFVGEADRLSRLVERYQQLGRLEISPRPLDLNRVVRDVAALARVGLPAGKRVEIDLSGDLPTAAGDSELLGAAIENVIRNAIEALKDAGCVTVKTCVSDADPTMCVVRVVDDGVGMNARDRERAVEEFFTTKRTGSGLGLSFARRVAEAHGGSVSLQSEEGTGTTVEIRFPAAH
jgi:signal transduction histidine kinase